MPSADPIAPGGAGRLRLYLTAGALHRPFDDPCYQREARAVLSLLRSSMAGDVTVLLSYAHFLDAADFAPMAASILYWLFASHALVVEPADDVVSLARTLHQRFALSGNDALHLACAIWRGATHFVTPDRSLIRREHELRVVTGAGLTLLSPSELDLGSHDIEPTKVRDEPGYDAGTDPLADALAATELGEGAADWQFAWQRRGSPTLDQYDRAARKLWAEHKQQVPSERRI